MDKILIVYYSYSGNTRKLSQYIADKTGADIAEIKTIIPYTDDYDAVVEQGQFEVNTGYMPEIMPLDIDMEKYSSIIIATPVWWYTYAPAVKTFMANYPLNNKKIYPIATNGGWLGHTHKDFEKAAVNSHVAKTLSVKFNETTMLTPKGVIDNWISCIQ